MGSKAPTRLLARVVRRAELLALLLLHAVDHAHQLAHASREEALELRYVTLHQVDRLAPELELDLEGRSPEGQSEEHGPRHASPKVVA